MPPRRDVADKLPRVLYIAGYGRSGSTVLDTILGSHESAVSCGEVTFLLDTYHDPHQSCACGAPFPACPIWAGLSEKLNVEQAAGVVRVVERRPAPPWPARTPTLAEKTLDEYRRIVSVVYDHLATAVGASVVIDSSKTAAAAALRPVRLVQAGMDVRTVHLRRGLAATLRSSKRSNRELEGLGKIRLQPLRSVPGYLLANLYARHAVHQIGPTAGLNVAYDQLLARPIEVIESIGRLIGLDYGEIGRRAAAGEAFTVGHNVGGNRVRRQGSVVLQGTRSRSDT